MLLGLSRVCARQARLDRVESGIVYFLRPYKSGSEIRREMRIIEYGKKYRKDMHVSTMAEWEPIKLSMKMRDVIVSKIKRNTIFCSSNSGRNRDCASIILILKRRNY